MNRKFSQHPVCFAWGEEESVNKINHFNQNSRNKKKRKLRCTTQQNNLILDVSVDDPEIHVICDVLSLVFKLGTSLDFRVCDLKARLAKLCGVPACLQFLFFNDVSLDDRDVLEDCGVKNGSVLILGVKLHTAICGECQKPRGPVSKAPVNINITSLSKVLYRAKVPPCNPVGDLKYIIEDKFNIYPDRQILIFNGKRLDEDRTLAEYGIKNGSSVLMVLYEYDGCNFCSGCSRILGLPTVTLEFLKHRVPWALYPEMTVAKLKETTYKYLNHIKPQLQRIYRDDNLLLDEQTLEKCDVVEGSVLNVRLCFDECECDQCHRLLLR